MKASERQKLKHDKYAETVVSGLRWSKEHQTTVVAAVAALLIIGGVIVWIIHARMQAQEDAQAQFAECQKNAESAMGMKDDARAEAVKDALNHLDGLVKSYPDSDVAPQALLQAADLLAATGEPAKAAAYYQRLVEMSGAAEGMKALALRGWAASLEQSGDAEKALAEYKALAEASTPQEAVEADWDVGRCYEILKDPENAKSFYKKAVEAGGDSKWAELARFRIESLDRASMAGSAESAPAATGAAPMTTAAPATTAAMPEPTISAPSSTTSTPASTTDAPAASGETAPK